MLFAVPDYLDSKTELLEVLAEKLNLGKLALVMEYNSLIGFDLLCFDLTGRCYDVDGAYINLPGAKERIMYAGVDLERRFDIKLVNRAVFNLIRNVSEKEE